MEQLDGRVAVITGGGSGIGEGLAQACHAAGMKLVVSDIEQAQAERVAEAVRDLGGDAVAVRSDVTDQASVDSLADQAYEAYGAVHLVCSNAGVLTVGPLMETSASDWQWLLNVNLFGAIHSANTFVPRMRAQGGEAHIAITASVAGTYAADDLEIGAYTASKYAVVGYAEMLRVELAPQGIGVSMFCPGTVTTRIGESSRNRPAELGGAGRPGSANPGGPGGTAGGASPGALAASGGRSHPRGGARQPEVHLLAPGAPGLRRAAAPRADGSLRGGRVAAPSPQPASRSAVSPAAARARASR